MKSLTLEATIENIPRVTAFVDELLEKNDCAMKAQLQIDVAIDEIFCNIASYAYGGATGEVTVQFDLDPSTRMASITFIDGGIPFDPLQQTDPDVTLSIEERQVGGLGIFLVKKTMDRMEYRREDDRNILTIHKCI